MSAQQLTLLLIAGNRCIQKRGLGVGRRVWWVVVVRSSGDCVDEHTMGGHCDITPQVLANKVVRRNNVHCSKGSVFVINAPGPVELSSLLSLSCRHLQFYLLSGWPVSEPHTDVDACHAATTDNPTFATVN